MKKLSILLLTIFSIVQLNAQKKVLIEHFSNASCSNCGIYSPQVFAFAEQNPNDVVVISYHAPFPYLHDSLHFDNETANNARINYYGVAGTPYTILEGNFERGPASTMLGKLNNKTTERINNAPTALPEVKISDVRLENGEVKAKVTFISTADIKDKNLRGHIVLIEKVVPKTAYVASPGTNSEQEYKNVMRQMYMPQSGFTLTNKGTANGDSLDVVFATTNVKNLNELRVVAFIQDNDSKEVYQVEAADLKSGTTGVGAVNTTATSWAYNPTANSYTVTFEKAVSGSITLTDITGKTISNIVVENEKLKEIPVSQLASGIYIATYTSGSTATSTKLWVR